MQEMHRETPAGNDRESRAPRISPAATALTLAAVAFAVLVGVTGPRLRDRVGSVQQDHPLGDLAAIAAMHEERAGADAAGGRERGAALARLPDLAESTVGRRGAPDLSAAGWTPDDARNVELAPGVMGTMVLYRGPSSAGPLSVTMLPDRGHAVRYDGFGRAAPIAPGDEWLELLEDDAGGRPRTAYALADGRVLWLVLAASRGEAAQVARLLK